MILLFHIYLFIYIHNAIYIKHMHMNIVYNYIIYPLILSPVYLLFGHGTDYFRLIQLWNMELSIPVEPLATTAFVMDE